MDRSLVVALFAAADARFDPCGAVVFARRLGREFDAGRIAFPRPLAVGGCPHGCLALDRFPADLVGVVPAARTLARGLLDIAGGGFTICVCGTGRAEATTSVTRAVAAELEVHRAGGAAVDWIGDSGRPMVFVVM